MSSAAIIVPRGCGDQRTPGDAYAESGLSENGKPIEDFLFDPPIPVPADLDVPTLGVKLEQHAQTGIWHVMDWIGRNHYPNVADYIEEVRRFGLSRKLPKNLDFSKLTKESRIFCIHSKAIVSDASSKLCEVIPLDDHGAAMMDGWLCPKSIAKHTPGDPSYDPSICCAGTWWENVEEGEPFDQERDEEELIRCFKANDLRRGAMHCITPLNEVRGYHSRLVKRIMPAFSYFAHRAPSDQEITYGPPAFFMALPLGRIAVVEGEGSTATAERISKATSLTVVEVAE